MNRFRVLETAQRALDNKTLLIRELERQAETDGATIAELVRERDHARDLACRLEECAHLTDEQREMLFKPMWVAPSLIPSEALRAWVEAGMPLPTDPV